MQGATLLRRHARFVAGTWLTLGIGAAVSLTVATLIRIRPGWPLAVTPLIRARAIPDTAWAAGWSADAITQAQSQAAGISALTSILAALAAAATCMALVNVIAIAAARWIENRRDTAVRSALGASPRRLRAERFAEASILFAGGLGLAWIGTAIAAHRLRDTWPAGLEPLVEAAPGTAIAVLLLVAVPLIAFVFRSGRIRPDLRGMLAGGTATADRHQRTRSAVPVAAGIALALTLACTTALLLRYGQSTLALDGFDADGMVTLEMGNSSPLPADRAAGYAHLLQRVHEITGVQAESIASPGAWLGMGVRDRVMAECGMCVRGGMLMPIVPAYITHHAVSPGFFEAVNIPVVAGRRFEAADNFDSARVAIVNEVFATRSFQNGQPIDRRVQIGGIHGEWYTIVGVVRDRRARGIGAPRVESPAIYLSTQQQPPATIGLAVRTAMGPDDVARRVGSATREITGTVIGEASTMTEQVERAVQPLRWFGRLFAVIALLAIGLALHGVYSVVRQNTQARRREIAIRAAVGAGPLRLLVLVLRQTTRITAVGLMLGLVGAWTAGRALQMKIGGMPTIDSATALGLAALLAIAALAGAMPPAAIAAVRPPVRVLRDP